MKLSTRPSPVVVALVLAVLASGALLFWRLPPRPVADLAKHERSVFSAGGEDGVLERLFEIIEPRNRYLVDLGAGDGIAGSSSRNLILNHGWRGLLVEAEAGRARQLAATYEASEQATTLHALIDPGDLEILLGAHGVPQDPDLLIVGLKANDWYVWRGIRDFRPRVVQIQYNAAFTPPQTMVIEYHPLNFWDGAMYFGASIQSLYNLGKRKGYELVYANTSGTNLFFVDARLFDRFGIRDNSPLLLYRPSRALPQIPPTRIRDWIGPGGGPLPPQSPQLFVENVRIPRAYVFDDLEKGGGS
jgi:hypothetical protein